MSHTVSLGYLWLKLFTCATYKRPPQSHCFKRWAKFQRRNSWNISQHGFKFEKDSSWKLAYLAEAPSLCNRHKKCPHLPQLSWQSTSASVSLQSGRNLKQKLWRLNWTNLYDRSRNQPHLPRCVLYCFVIPLTTFSRDHRSCDFSCKAAQHLYVRILNFATESLLSCRGIEWSLRAFASMRALCLFCEHEQLLNFSCEQRAL